MNPVSFLSFAKAAAANKGALNKENNFSSQSSKIKKIISVFLNKKLNPKKFIK